METLVSYTQAHLQGTELLIDLACRRHHDSLLQPGQYSWDQLTLRKDPRIDVWRTQMMLALKEILVIPLDFQPTSWTPAHSFDRDGLSG